MHLFTLGGLFREKCCANLNGLGLSYKELCSPWKELTLVQNLTNNITDGFLPALLVVVVKIYNYDTIKVLFPIYTNDFIFVFIQNRISRKIYGNNKGRENKLICTWDKHDYVSKVEPSVMSEYPRSVDSWLGYNKDCIYLCHHAHVSCKFFGLLHIHCKVIGKMGFILWYLLKA